MESLVRDTRAASPLTVILTVAAVVAGVTAFLFFAFADFAGPSMRLQQVDVQGVPAFEVTAVHGKMDWADLKVEFLTPGGFDQAAFYLVTPTGPVHSGDHIQLRSAPPAGPYLLDILKDGTSRARIAAHY